MTFFRIRLKNASSIAFWVTGAMVVMLILALGMLFNELGGLSIQVGIYGDSPPILISDDWTLIHYHDLEQMQQDVANRRLELGYAFSENGIILYTSPATVTDNVINLLIAASQLEMTAGEIGAGSLNFFMEANAIDIQERVEYFLADGPLMERVVVTHGQALQAGEIGNNGQQAGQNNVTDVPYRRLFHGMMALFAQLIAMLCAMNYANKNEMVILGRLKKAGIGKWWLYVLAGIGSIVILTGIVMSLAAFFAAWIFPGVWLLQDIPAGLIYLIAISSLAVFWAMVLPEGAYPPFLIVVFVFTVLMGGVIFDLREVMESVGFLRLLFPGHYYMSMVG